MIYTISTRTPPALTYRYLAEGLTCQLLVLLKKSDARPYRPLWLLTSGGCECSPLAPLSSGPLPFEAPLAWVETSDAPVWVGGGRDGWVVSIATISSAPLPLATG